MILIIDNYDSFTFNIVEYFRELKEKVLVKRNDEIDFKGIKKLAPQKIIISPGPSHPRNSGFCNQMIKEFYKDIPILGVCLGHQCIAFTFGSKIIRAKKIYHGKSSQIIHGRENIFKTLPSPFSAIRYHSLVVDKKSLPDFLEVIATSNEDKEIMAFKHRTYPLWGVQFHPESIGSTYGHELFKNFIKQ